MRHQWIDSWGKFFGCEMKKNKKPRRMEASIACRQPWRRDDLRHVAKCCCKQCSWQCTCGGDSWFVKGTVGSSHGPHVKGTTSLPERRLVREENKKKREREFQVHRNAILANLHPSTHQTNKQKPANRIQFNVLVFWTPPELPASSAFAASSVAAASCFAPWTFRRMAGHHGRPWCCPVLLWLLIKLWTNESYSWLSLTQLREARRWGLTRPPATVWLLIPRNETTITRREKKKIRRITTNQRRRPISNAHISTGSVGEKSEKENNWDRYSDPSASANSNSYAPARIPLPFGCSSNPPTTQQQSKGEKQRKQKNRHETFWKLRN